MDQSADKRQKQADIAAWELFRRLSESPSTGEIVEGYSYVLIPYFSFALELAFEKGVSEGIDRVSRELGLSPAKEPEAV